MSVLSFHPGIGKKLPPGLFVDFEDPSSIRRPDRRRA
jgi:hypothetical protein